MLSKTFNRKQTTQNKHEKIIKNEEEKYFDRI